MLLRKIAALVPLDVPGVGPIALTHEEAHALLAQLGARGVRPAPRPTPPPPPPPPRFVRPELWRCCDCGDDGTGFAASTRDPARCLRCAARAREWSR